MSKFESLYIYGSNPQYGRQTHGKVKMSNELGEVELNLDDQACQQILELIATEMMRVTQTLADDMTAKIIEGFGLEQKAIEGTKP